VAVTNQNDETISAMEARRLALLVLQSARFPFLATLDGNQPRLRPVSPLRTDGFTVYIASLRRYGKTAEIAANPHVELGYLDAHHNQVRITGLAEVVTDRMLLQEIWDANSLLRQYLGSPDNPNLVLYRIRPSRVRYMREWALDYHEVPLEA
jgi:general stress protein 26